MLDALRILEASPAVFIGVCVVLGLLVGSFLNVVIYRLPKMLEREWHAQCAELRGEAVAPAAPLNLATPRSACPACGHPITALENIPVISWLMLGGKCSACRAPISKRYPLVEMLTGILSGLVAWRFGVGWGTLGALILAWGLIALTFIDFDTQLLPDTLTLPLLWIGLLFNLRGTFTDLTSAVVGAIAGYLSLWSVYWLFKLVRGKEGMGYGDFKLLAAIGAWLGWKLLLPVILLSSVLGAIIGSIMLRRAGQGRETPFSFGPYLALGGIVALLFGDAIVRAYLEG